MIQKQRNVREKEENLHSQRYIMETTIFAEESKEVKEIISSASNQEQLCARGQDHRFSHK